MYQKSACFQEKSDNKANRKILTSLKNVLEIAGKRGKGFFMGGYLGADFPLNWPLS